MEEVSTTFPTRPRNVAEYIEWQIHLSGKKQLDIARESGFEKPNVVTMIKQGKTKLPLDKVGRFAKSIGVDPIFLFKMVLQEYHQETWEEIQRMFEQEILTENEMEIIRAVRQSKVVNPSLASDDDRQKLINFVDNNLRGDNVDIGNWASWKEQGGSKQ